MNTDRPDMGVEAVQRLLESYPGPPRRLRPRHWAGIVVLAVAIGAAGLAVPSLLSLPPSAVPPPAWLLAPPSSSPAPTTGSGAGTSSPTAPPRTTATAPAPTRSTAPPPKPAPSRSPSRKSFTPVVVQAENGKLSEGASTTSCDGCGAGARVRYLGRVEVGVTVAVAGRRTITVAYTVEGTRRLSVAVNGTVVMSRRSVSGSSWSDPRRVSVEADVPAGLVTIAVYGANEAPDVDSIALTG